MQENTGTGCVRRLELSESQPLFTSGSADEDVWWEVTVADELCQFRKRKGTDGFICVIEMIPLCLVGHAGTLRCFAVASLLLSQVRCRFDRVFGLHSPLAVSRSCGCNASTFD